MDYGDRVVFYHHQDRNELVDKLNLIAPVLFDREPGMGFEPEGSYQQFNDVFAEMVAWHNAAGITGNGHFVISRPDVDLHRQRSEQYYHEYIRQQKSISGGMAHLMLQFRIMSGRHHHLECRDEEWILKILTCIS